MHYEWMEATVKLLANTVNFEHNFTKEELIACANIFIETTTTSSTEKECIDINDASSITSARPQVLDKDNDSNYHIKWIQLSSNLRATNYNIEPVDFYTTKGIAGKIIPAVSTTTSVVGGLIVLEMMKYLQHGNKDIEKYKSTFINLSDNTFVSSEPLESSKIKIGTLELNGWFKFKWDKDSTLAEFKEYFDNIFKSPISMITYNSGMLYSSFMGDSDLTKKFSQVLLNICPNIDLKNQVEILVMCDDDELEIPPILLNITC
jgi:ubiquitin-activating enzyme E1